MSVHGRVYDEVGWEGVCNRVHIMTIITFPGSFLILLACTVSRVFSSQYLQVCHPLFWSWCMILLPFLLRQCWFFLKHFVPYSCTLWRGVFYIYPPSLVLDKIANYFLYIRVCSIQRGHCHPYIQAVWRICTLI